MHFFRGNFIFALFTVPSNNRENKMTAKCLISNKVTTQILLHTLKFFISFNTFFLCYLESQISDFLHANLDFQCCYKTEFWKGLDFGNIRNLHLLLFYFMAVNPVLRLLQCLDDYRLNTTVRKKFSRSPIHFFVVSILYSNWPWFYNLCVNSKHCSNFCVELCSFALCVVQWRDDKVQREFIFMNQYNTRLRSGEGEGWEEIL